MSGGGAGGLCTVRSQLLGVGRAKAGGRARASLYGEVQCIMNNGHMGSLSLLTE